MDTINKDRNTKPPLFKIIVSVFGIIFFQALLCITAYGAFLFFVSSNSDNEAKGYLGEICNRVENTEYVDSKYLEENPPILNKLKGCDTVQITGFKNKISTNDGTNRTNYDAKGIINYRNGSTKNFEMKYYKETKVNKKSPSSNSYFYNINSLKIY